MISMPIPFVRYTRHIHQFSEAFISDNGSNLFSVDLRNGKIAYGYKGL